MVRRCGARSGPPRVDIGGMQPDAGHGVRKHSPHRPASTAHVDDERPRHHHVGGAANKEFRTTAGNEHPGIDRDPHTTEFHPAQHVFEGAAVDPLLHERFQIRRGVCSSCE